MKKIATLGPKGTFSEVAVKKYIEFIKEDAETIFYPTITKAFNAIGEECELGIIPIENTLDGYVHLSLDLLSQTDLHIISELVIPIQFSFVGNTADINNIKKVYVQFKAQGQCCKFLEQLEDVKIITTDSNIESLQCAKEGSFEDGAVVPQHIINTENKFPLVIETITDSKENETRFIVLKRGNIAYDENKHYKTSIVITNTVDKPGALAAILNEFSQKNINLNSIMSRPTKEVLGKYIFFIDIDGHYLHDVNVKQALEEIRKENVVRILGSFPLI
jgi:Prephenate dehydratase